MAIMTLTFKCGELARQMFISRIDELCPYRREMIWFFHYLQTNAGSMIVLLSQVHLL